MCEVECILNNRPLTEITQDPNDLDALTPNHILLFKNFVTFPPGCFNKNDNYVRRRWKQIQYLADLFWKRWHRQYLVLLQERCKWQDVRKNFVINDLVLVMNVNLPRSQWPLGRIVSIDIGNDNLVRSVDVKLSKCRNSNLKDFQTTVVSRPIVKLVKLCSLDSIDV